MMAHFVNKLSDGLYQAPRKTTDNLYQSRTPQDGVPLENARLFNTKSAATNAMKSAGLIGQVHEVYLMVGPPVD